MVIYFTGNFTGVLEYIKETFWMLPVSIIKKKYFRGLSNVIPVWNPWDNRAYKVNMIFF